MKRGEVQQVGVHGDELGPKGISRHSCPCLWSNKGGYQKKWGGERKGENIQSLKRIFFLFGISSRTFEGDVGGRKGSRNMVRSDIGRNKTKQNNALYLSTIHCKKKGAKQNKCKG